MGRICFLPSSSLQRQPHSLASGPASGKASSVSSLFFLTPMSRYFSCLDPDSPLSLTRTFVIRGLSQLTQDHLLIVRSVTE